MVVGNSEIRTPAFPLRVILAHALPNAAIPILMFLGIEIGLILTGAVVTETIFAWPGLGRVLVTAVGQRDLPVVQAAILLIALIMVLSNLIVDFVHAAIDPRAEIIAPALAIRKTGYGEPPRDYKQELRDALKE